jgi:integrase
MPKKRGNNEGTIRQRSNGTWEARFTVGYASDGKLIQKSVYSTTREDAQKKMREAIRQIERGEYVEPNKLTLSEWLDTWLTVYGRPRWRDSTAGSNYKNIQANLKPALGKHLLQKIRPEHIQAFINKQVEKGYAPASIRRQITLLKSALEQAVDNQLIVRNPANKAKLPQASQKEIEFLTIDEQRKLIAQLPDNTYGRALRFIIGTGLRASELCGLRWMDIFEDYFSIRQGLHIVINLEAKEGDKKTEVAIAPPKTQAGRRSIPLPPSLKMLLDKQLKSQRKDRLEAGSAWVGGIPGQSDTYVFASLVGSPLDRHNLARTLRDSLSSAGLKHRGVHALRHTFATNCIRAGVDVRTLSTMIGHTKIAFTLQQYVHTDMSTMRAAINALEHLY